MATLIMVRHGQSQWNLENRFTGWVDVELSDLGRKEAAAAGEALKGYSFDVAFTSDLKRAQNTLQLILEGIGQSGIPVNKDQALNERHYGDLQGLNKAETAVKYGDEQVLIWRRSFDIAPPNGESLKDTAARTLPYFIDNIEPLLKAGKNVIIAAHGNSLRSIAMYLEKMSKEEILKFEIPTGKPRLYRFDDQMNVVEKRYVQE
jgi:2,3-bisphosphoglycerate-dependent phosphoglycerate mutase